MLLYRSTSRSTPLYVVTVVLVMVGGGLGAVAQCPWGRDTNLVELQSACLCAINLSQVRIGKTQK